MDGREPELDIPRIHRDDLGRHPLPTGVDSASLRFCADSVRVDAALARHRAASLQVGGHEEAHAVVGLQGEPQRHRRPPFGEGCEGLSHRLDGGGHVDGGPDVGGGQDSKLHAERWTSWVARSRDLGSTSIIGRWRADATS